MVGMVTVNGVRYRIEDAQRLGLVEVAEPGEEKTRDAKTPKNKAAKPANK